MSIAEYCTVYSGATRHQAAPLFHCEGSTPWLVTLNSRWSPGQKSARNDVLLRSLKIAVLPRGDWQIIPDWARKPISGHLDRKGLSKEVVFLTTSTLMIARDERIRSKLERCGLGWIPLGHPCPVRDSLTAVTPLLALLPRVGPSWMGTTSCISSPERWEKQGITRPGRGS